MHDTIMYFKHLLLGREIFILTDSKALTFNLQIDKQSDVVNLWLLMDFSIKLFHNIGCKNLADFLSCHVMAWESISFEYELFRSDSELIFERT